MEKNIILDWEQLQLVQQGSKEVAVDCYDSF